MPRVASKVTQSDVARVLRAIAQVGAQMRVEVLPDGTIRMEPVEVAAESGAVQYKGEIRL